MKNIVYIVGLALMVQSCSADKVDKGIEGKVEREQLSVTTKISGKIQKILVEEGQMVHKGDTLFILELKETVVLFINKQKLPSLTFPGVLEAFFFLMVIF